MPCAEANAPERHIHSFEDERFPIVEHLKFHYQLAEGTQLITHMAELNFNRKTKGDSTLLATIAKDKIPPIKIDVMSILYKRQLLQDLLENHITFDSYRSNTRWKDYIVARRIAALNHRYSIPSQKQIHIHECDFIEYQLNRLRFFSQHVQESYPAPLYRFYSVDQALEEKFKRYIGDIKSGKVTDTRMHYDDVFQAS